MSAVPEPRADADASPPGGFADGDGVCPFCGERDFDLVGLKGHFEKGYCGIYNETGVR